ncbi:MAG TPA: rRNA maturation RNase YbeY [Candidatus Dormibacteraeota bacterium]|nr:rRNA maturation RNase YbeY [Candidatus Dormibacteraeota bacterium]
MTVLEVELVKAVPAPVTPAFVRSLLRRAAKVPEMAARLPEGDATVAVRITDDNELRALNKTYAGEDHATDVLSFEGAGNHVGDIAVSWPRVVEQAQQGGHSEKDELSVLLVHGLLHLLGWDHVTTAETEEMWRLTYIPLRGLRRSPRA